MLSTYENPTLNVYLKNTEKQQGMCHLYGIRSFATFFSWLGVDDNIKFKFLAKDRRTHLEKKLIWGKADQSIWLSHNA